MSGGGSYTKPLQEMLDIIAGSGAYQDIATKQIFHYISGKRISDQDSML